jgi:hypothetical protein
VFQKVSLAYLIPSLSITGIGNPGANSAATALVRFLPFMGINPYLLF